MVSRSLESKCPVPKGRMGTGLPSMTAQWLPTDLQTLPCETGRDGRLLLIRTTRSRLFTDEETGRSEWKHSRDNSPCVHLQHARLCTGV